MSLPARLDTPNANVFHLGKIARVTPIEIQTNDETISLSVVDVLHWVAPNAPEDEALKFLMVCRARRLNPLLGEADLVPFGTKWQTVVSKSGYIKLMEEHPMYAGHEAGIIVRDFDFTTRMPVGPERYLEGSYRPKECPLVGGWARIYRKDRKTPVFVAISAEEYNKGTGTYATIPCTMLRKVALVQCASESGLINAPRGYLPEEAPQPVWAEHPDRIEHTNDQLEIEYSHARDDASLPVEYLSQIVSLRDQLGIPEDSETWRIALADRNVGHAAELTVPQATSFIAKLAGLLPHPDLTSDDRGEEEVIDIHASPAESFSLPEFSRTPKKGSGDADPLLDALAESFEMTMAETETANETATETDGESVVEQELATA